MKKIVEDKLSMYKRVLLILAQNQIFYSVLLALVNSVNLLTTKVTTLDAVITQHIQILRGITRSKKVAKAKLINLMLRLNGALLAYAALTHIAEKTSRNKKYRLITPVFMNICGKQEVYCSHNQQYLF